MPLDHYPGEARIAYPDNEPFDSAGRFRVSFPIALIAAQFHYDTQPLLFDQLTVNGSVVHIPNIAAVRLSTLGTADGDGAIFQSKRYLRYRPDRSHQIVCTGVLGPQETNVTKSVGLLDSQDGLAFVQNNAGIGVLLRSSTSGSPVDIVKPQSEWELDRLDGTGPSEITLNPENDNVFVIDTLWLGAGMVRWGMKFGGRVTYVHEMIFGGTQPVPFMRTANLPVRAEIRNTGVAGAVASLDFMCLVVNSEAGTEPEFTVWSTSNAHATDWAIPMRQVSSSLLPLLSIRPRTTFHGLTNRGQVQPTSFEIVSQNFQVAYVVIENGTLTGSAFADVNTSDSIAEVDVAATGISGGRVVASGYLGGVVGVQGLGLAEKILDKIILSNNIVGDVTDMITIAARTVSGGDSGCAAGLTWQEER